MPNSIPLNLLTEIIKEQARNLTDADKTKIIEALLVDQGRCSQHIICPIGINKFVNVNVNSILYLTQPFKKIATLQLVTGEEIIYNLMNTDLLEYISENFNQFKLLDQVSGILVNMSTIIKYDSYMHRVYFSDEHYIQVAGAAIRKIVSPELGKELDMCNRESANKKKAIMKLKHIPTNN